MKTKGFIYLISIFLVMILTSCEEEHIRTEFGDSVGFADDYYFISAKQDFTYLEIPVTHRSINVLGSKAEIEIVSGEGTPVNIATIDRTELNFDESDTIIVKLSLNYSSLIEDQVFSVTLRFTDKYLQYRYGGYEEVTVEMTKWRPRRMSDFIGTYTVEAVSNYEPGSWDEAWEVTTEADDTDPNKLLITGIAGSDVAVEAILDFDNLTITIPYGQDIGDVYGYGATLLYNSNADLEILASDLTGSLYENNNFMIDYMVMWENDAGWDWDIFTPEFTKQ